MASGTEWIVDAFGCSAAALADMVTVRRICDEVIRELGLCVVGTPQWHQFPDPGGVTGLYLLSESHLACHTWPESRAATFNLFCCRARDEYAWGARLEALLGARSVRVSRVPRGTPEEGPSQ